MNISRGKIPGAKKIVIYGVEGIGKSTLASQFPQPVFIDTEGSTKELDVSRFDPPQSWPELIGQVQYVIDHPDVCRTLVLDTADWAEQLMIRYLCQKNKWESLESAGYGKGYQIAAEEWSGQLLARLSEVVRRGVHVVITAHAWLRKVELPEESASYDHWEMKTSKKIAPMIREWGDAVFFLHYETIVVKNEEKKGKAQGGRRVIETNHAPFWDAKNRFGLPDKLPLDFGQLAPLFQPVVPQTEPQQADLPVIADPDPDCPFTGPAPEAPDVIPPELWKLMQRSGVGEAEVVAAVAAAGYFPANMQIKQYPPDFIKHLINVWDQVYIFIQKLQNRKENH